MFTVQWKETALKSIEKLDNSISSRIFKKIEELKEGFTGKDIKCLKGEKDTYRLRVGDYRVIFELRGNLITILIIGHRKNIYEKF
ncbi:type II toxin-antitoxin system RelE/ParE family toxin [Candidatus Pacearchaeota archaeon]|nr:type II toxin-antitoxin system RelE/ParE family toxin [Candidatus Pacearchaeota archaeon]